MVNYAYVYSNLFNCQLFWLVLLKLLKSLKVDQNMKHRSSDRNKMQLRGFSRYRKTSGESSKGHVICRHLAITNLFGRILEVHDATSVSVREKPEDIFVSKPHTRRIENMIIIIRKVVAQYTYIHSFKFIWDLMVNDCVELW